VSTKSFTIKLNEEEEEDLQYIIDFFQKNSITTIRRGDVIRYLSSIFKIAIENGNFDEIRELTKPKKED
jgi:hypothetical protein